MSIHQLARSPSLPSVEQKLIELASCTVTFRYRFIKRYVDIVGAGALAALLSPLFALTAILIKLTSEGPILYWYPVVGLQGRVFTSCKFRTMVKNAESLKGEIADLNEMVGPVFKMREDPRITPLGRFLRKYSIDELPQLWIVLKGDMSLVGPRPPGPHEVEKFKAWQHRKLSATPGITCLWQVNGRNAVNLLDDWVKMDLDYIDNWSLWLDLRIIWKTVWVVLAGTGY